MHNPDKNNSPSFCPNHKSLYPLSDQDGLFEVSYTFYTGNHPYKRNFVCNVFRDAGMITF